MEYIPFTYVLRWTEINKSYYGVRYAVNKTAKGGIANPETLWTTYFTSSTDVDKIVAEHGDPDVIQIRRTFTDGTTAKRWETSVLRRLKVIHREDWINRGYCDFNGIISSAWTEERREKFMQQLTPEKRKKISEWVTKANLNQSDKTRQRRSTAAKGKIVSQETRDRQSKSRMGRIITPEWRSNISKATKGVSHTKEHNINATQGKMDKRGYNWEITLPDNTKIIIQNLAQFCREHNIGPSNLVSQSTKGLKSEGYFAVKVWHN